MDGDDSGVGWRPASRACPASGMRCRRSWPPRPASPPCSSRATACRARLLGLPDFGYLTQTEMADVARRVCRGGPGDDGGGRRRHRLRQPAQHHAHGRAVGAGRRGRHLPRGSGVAEAVRPHGRQAGRAGDEWLAKLRAACDHRDRLHVTARTDARAVVGLDEPSSGPGWRATPGVDARVRRGAARASPSSRPIAAALPGITLVANMVETGQTPLLTPAELADLGFTLIVSPLTALFAATKALRDSLGRAARDGHAARPPRPARRLRRLHPARRPRRPCRARRDAYSRLSSPRRCARWQRCGARRCRPAIVAATHQEWPDHPRMARSGNLGRKPQGAISSASGGDVAGEPPATKLPARGAPPNRAVATRREEEPMRSAAARERAPGVPATRPAGASSCGSPTDRPFALEGGGAPARRDHRLRDLGHARRRGVQRRARVPRLDGRQPRRRAHRARAPDARLVGGHGRPGHGARHRPLLRRVRQRARRLPGLDRPGVDRPGDRPALRLALPGGHHPRHGAGPGRAGRPPRRARGGSRVIGGSMGGMQVLEWGDHVPRPRALAHPDRHAARRPPRSRSRGRRSAAAPSGSTRAGAAATTTTPSRARARTRAWRSPAMLAQVTFRSDDVFTDRFGRELADARRADGFDLWQRFEVERYLDHHGDKLVRRFDANRYLLLSARRWTCTTWAGAGAASTRRMARIKVPTLTIGIWSDMLYPRYQQRRSASCCTPPGHAGRVRRDRLAARPRRLPHRPRPGGRRRRRRSSTTWRSVTTMSTRSMTAPAARDASPSAPAAPTTAPRWRPMLWALVGVRDADARRGPPHVDRRRAPSSFYSRYSNPTVKAFEDAIAAARGRRGGAGVRLGHGRAGHAWCFALCSPGDHIVAQRQIYSRHAAVPAGRLRPLRHRRHVRRRHRAGRASPPPCGPAARCW